MDSIMGSGKSTWAINYINTNPDKKFLCVVPTIDECTRYKRDTNINIFEPKLWGTKRNHFNYLVKNEQNIVTTHALIQKLDLRTLELLKNKEYVLIIDECLEVLSPYKITSQDTAMLFTQNYISLGEDGFLVWNEKMSSYEGKFTDVKRLCEFKSLMGFEKEKSTGLAKILIWNFPVPFFYCFEESYILTYLWEGSIQKSYFDIHRVPYKKYMLNDGVLIEYDEILAHKKRMAVADLINIYEGKFNNIGAKIGKSNPLSKSWYKDRRKKKSPIFDQLINNTENFFRTVAKTDSDDNMYTVFKSYYADVKGRGFSRKTNRIPCNARGTNDYRHKKALAYLINFFITPEMKQFINHYDIEFDEDLFALSTLLQWIWRSQIRDGKSIHIYIPSERMRGLLKAWIEDCKQVENVA